MKYMEEDLKHANYPDDEPAVELQELETVEEPQHADALPRPLGEGEYEVDQGECVASIAFEHGHFWETIWNDPANLDLKNARGNPYVLLPGDRLHIPPLQAKVESGSTEQRHRFKRKGVPEKLHIRILDENGKPLSGVNYSIEVDGHLTASATDAEGNIVHYIPPNARYGTILLPKLNREIPLSLGWLDPAMELSGVQARLNNLGYDAGEEDGRWDDSVREAIWQFQQVNNLPVTGELDEMTRSKLTQLYGR
jgi:hypothetical protein